MTSNNAFKPHGINHLSPSSINSFIGDLPMWIMRYLYNVRDNAGVGALRGIATETTLQKKYENGFFDYSLQESEFIRLVNENQLNQDDTKTLKEKDNLVKYGSILDEHFNYDGLISVQEKVEIQPNDLPIPILGYIDFNFTKAIVDLKTTARMPSQPSEGHKRQMAFYSLAYPEKEIHLFYVTPREHKVFNISKQTLKNYQEQLLNIAFSIQNYLSQSSDRVILTNRTYPNFDKWEWSESMKNEAKKIWSIK